MKAEGMTRQRRAQAKFFAAAALALTLATAGCAHKDRSITTGSVSTAANADIASMSMPQLAAAARGLGDRYIRNPKDKAVALRYASVLQMSGHVNQSLAVMRKLAIGYPEDRDVLAAYGKALAAAGELEPALDAVRRAQTPEYPDWRLLSAEGAILDQLGQAEAARTLYRRALDLQPDEPSVLSNLGMSYLLEGDLRTAEIYMAKAAAAPGADSRVRQNLALVVGLQGRFAEAKQIARQELSPEQAEANLAYLRAMLAQNDSWSEIAREDSGQRG